MKRMIISVCLSVLMLGAAVAQQEPVEPTAATEKGLIEQVYHGDWNKPSGAVGMDVRGIPAVQINGKVFQIETESGFVVSAPRYPEVQGFEDVKVGMLVTLTYVTYDKVSYVQSILVE